MTAEPTAGLQLVEPPDVASDGTPERVLSGRLTAAGRQAALARALPLVGTYFEQGTRPLHVQPGPSRPDPCTDTPADDTSRLVGALRLRVALAAAERLADIAAQIAARPSFRYQRQRAETIGVVRGRLDVMRYATGTHRLQQPPRYPVLEAVRSQATLENTLLVCAAQWLLEELARPAVVAGLPDPGPERSAARAATGDLRGLLTLPLFAACRAAARDTARRRDLPRLLRQVEQRLAAGHVLNRGPYRELTAWMGDCLRGAPAALPGDLDWSFYGAEFDPKLFELWCLTTLAESVGEALGQLPPPPDLTRRARAPMYIWHTALGDLEIHYQRSPSNHTPGWPATWTKPESTALMGIPDISIIGRAEHTGDRLVLLDPKLRQRTGVPGDELYKVLGYFEQYGQHERGQGAVLLYGADDRAVAYTTRTGGRLLETTVDPTGDPPPGESDAWMALTRLALEAVGLGTLAPPPRRTLGGHDPDADAGDPELVVGQAQQRAVLVLQALAEVVGDNALRPWRNQLETAFPGTWHRLGDDTQEMCTTAVYLGNVLTEGRDFSGAVLGLAAAAETLLWELVLEPAAELRPEVARQHMLGQMLATLDNAVGGAGSGNAHAVRHVLAAKSVKADSLGPVVSALMGVNRDHRRAAAHRDLVPRSSWLDCYRTMITGADPVLPRLAELLLPPDALTI